AGERGVVHLSDTRQATGQAVDRLHPVQVEPALLVTTPGRAVGHHVIRPVVGQFERAGPLLLGALLRYVAAVVGDVGPRQTHVAGDAGCDSRYQTRQQLLLQGRWKGANAIDAGRHRTTDASRRVRKGRTTRRTAARVVV